MKQLLTVVLEKHQVSEMVILEALIDYVEHTNNYELLADLWEVLHARGLCDYWS